jgi:hypothetical protein
MKDEDRSSELLFIYLEDGDSTFIRHVGKNYRRHIAKNHNLDTPLRNFNLIFSAVLLFKLQHLKKLPLQIFYMPYMVYLK